MLRTCKKCNQELPLEDFVNHKGSKHGKDYMCKPCCAKRSREYRLRNPRKASENSRRWQLSNPERFKRAQWERDLRIHFGLNVEGWTKMLIEQSGRCAVCGNPFDERQQLLKASVDHDHATNEVRELLHKNCNLLLGVANDDVNILLGAIEYLKRHA